MPLLGIPVNIRYVNRSSPSGPILVALELWGNLPVPEADTFFCKFVHNLLANGLVLNLYEGSASSLILCFLLRLVLNLFIFNSIVFKSFHDVFLGHIGWNTKQYQLVFQESWYSLIILILLWLVRSSVAE